MESRRVGACGTISWRGAPLFIATALAGEYVALEEVDDGIWTVYFARMALARYDERLRLVRPIHLAGNTKGGAPPASLAPRLT